MQAIRRWAGAAAVAVVLAASSVAQAAYTNLIVFGDSLSDPGNAAALTPRASPLPPLFPPTPSGRFTNGPTAAEYLAASYGIPTVLGWPTAAGANNMAIGGALTGDGNYNFIVNSPAGLTGYPAVANTGVAQQITTFVGANPGALANANALTLLWAGPNDFFLGFELGTDPSAVISAAVNNMANNIGALAMAGAKNILVPNMPDLGKTPALIQQGPLFAAGASTISNLYNFYLAQAITQAALNLGPLGVNLYTADTAGLLLKAINDPGAFGFTNVTQGCIDDPAAFADNCAGYLFFDGVHPTTAAHRLLAGEFAAAVPEPSTYALLALGLMALLLFTRRRAA